MNDTDTGGTDGTPPGGPTLTPDLGDRLETLTETVSLTNMRMRRMAEEIAALRYFVVFALCLAGAFYYYRLTKGAVTP
jgi:hypothetical protein